MSRLLLDMGLARRAAADLRQLGHDVAHVAEQGLALARDAEILDAARNDHRIVVTLDRDFTDILAVEGSETPSVIFIRMDGLSRERAVKLIQAVVTRLPTDDAPCYVATVSRSGVRVRGLPI